MLLKVLKVQRGQPALDPDPSGPTRRTVNGLWKPRLQMQPGQLEFWRVGNIGANIYYKLHLDGQPVVWRHIVQHADQGMMANVLVIDPRSPNVVHCQPPSG
jgi:hypothetical protein